MSTQLEVRLWPKTDKNGDEYLIGDAQSVPALVDLRECTFLVFYPPDDGEGESDAPKHASLIIRRDIRPSRRD